MQCRNVPANGGRSDSRFRLPPPSIGRSERSRLLSLLWFFFLAFVATNVHNYRMNRKYSFHYIARGLVEQQLRQQLDPNSLMTSTADRFADKNDDDASLTPKIVWLLSFPNSGTSFTMNMAQRMSNQSMATNYGEECTTEDAQHSLPIHAGKEHEGPFWGGMSGKMTSQLGIPRPLPETYVLTKTHCGSRCGACGPTRYIETAQSFREKCSKGFSLQNGKRVEASYPESRVHKAIHLVRNPYHNLIARFHLATRRLQKKGKDTTPYTDSTEGFQQWCADLDGKYPNQVKRIFGPKLWSLMQKVPCHAEFFQYVQWHNLALKAIQELALPSLLIHYEDYEVNLNATADSIIEFLELPQVGSPKPFKPRTDYEDFFSEDQRQSIYQFLQRMASNRTWHEIERYL